MKSKIIYIGGGCFWGVEAYYKKLKGIISTCVGYANGITSNPKYEEVKSQKTKHVECVKLIYNPDIMSLEKICEHFLRFVNPYSLNKQGEDVGIQYRNGIYFVDDEDEIIIRDYFDKNLNKGYVTEIKKLENFYKGEECHQNYLDKNPQGYCHVNLNLINKEELK